jgi:hypothetical protein
MGLAQKICHLTHLLAGTRNALIESLSLPRSAIALVVDDDKKNPNTRASLRLWLAVLLSVVALWFLDGLLKPTGRESDSDRK